MSDEGELVSDGHQTIWVIERNERLTEKGEGNYM